MLTVFFFSLLFAQQFMYEFPQKIQKSTANIRISNIVLRIETDNFFSKNCSIYVHSFPNFSQILLIPPHLQNGSQTSVLCLDLHRIRNSVFFNQKNRREWTSGDGIAHLVLALTESETSALLEGFGNQNLQGIQKAHQWHQNIVDLNIWSGHFIDWFRAVGKTNLLSSWGNVKMKNVAFWD